MVATVSIIAVVLGLVFVLHVVNKLSVRVTNVNGQEGPVTVNTPAPASINIPIYVVGPTTLVQKLINAGINQSLIKPATINQLPNLPNNSIIVIDWSVLGPSIVINGSSSKSEVNLASPVIGLLGTLFKHGDLIILYGSRSELVTMEFVLTYSWAREFNITIAFGSEKYYPVPAFIMPISSNMTAIMAFVKPGHGRYLIIRPIYVDNITMAVVTWHELGSGLAILPQSYSGDDVSLENTNPCWAYYEYGVPSGFIFIWGGSLVTGNNPTWGIPAYTDSLGDEFYYDSCLLIYDQVSTAYSPARIASIAYGMVAYSLSQSGYVWAYVYQEIAGYDLYSSYTEFAYGLNPYVPIDYPVNSFYANSGTNIIQPTPTSPSFTISLPPSVSITYPNVCVGVDNTYGTTPYPGNYAYNFTWIFTPGTGCVGSDTPATYIYGFSTGLPGYPAFVSIPGYSTPSSSAQISFFLPFYAEVSLKPETITPWPPIPLCIWADAYWLVTLTATSTNSVSLSNASFNVPGSSGQYISGTSSNTCGS
ncbi:hypothetical protein VMUT_1004 [Vulcanisaeta moutnovskia 768-28]|uniref:Uncharacterized protein n=1 Tax=Vulcanisaeta moutnovskia (strain 768-28) TaxID=985053 RepID=F0QXP8_VULM7|nr:hypothetical protein VMUT_1004 [Vulcanisaeta moutnovskia 768-28]